MLSSYYRSIGLDALAKFLPRLRIQIHLRITCDNAPVFKHLALVLLESVLKYLVIGMNQTGYFGLCGILTTVLLTTTTTTIVDLVHFINYIDF